MIAFASSFPPAVDLAVALLLVATPLALAALGEWWSERGGLLNVGIEGALLLSCFAAFAAASATGSALTGAAAGAAAGALSYAAVASFVDRLRADAVVTGTAFNLLALGLTAFLFRGHAEGRGSAVVAGLVPLALPLAAPILMLLSHFAIERTRFGLEVRACGEGREAARGSGVDVALRRLAAAAIGGLLVGLAGAQLALVEARTFVEGMSGGRGFLALAIVVCGRWRAPLVLLAALAFGAAYVFQYQLQARGATRLYPLFLGLPYVATLVVLAIAAGRSRAPADLNR
jgi:ABC-type uncharacterized transport system permease subunit